MRPRYTIVTIACVVLLLLASVAPAVGEDQTEEDQTVGVTVRTPGLLAIEVDQAVALGITPPGATTEEVGFHIGIVNTTSEGWEVHVTATDFESYSLECDEQGANCARIPTDPVHTIAASNLHMRGGGEAALAGTSEMSQSEGHFVAAGTPLPLLTGTGGAAGTLAIDGPQTIMRLDVPADAADGDYTATLTYTIMGATP